MGLDQKRTMERRDRLIKEKGIGDLAKRRCTMDLQFCKKGVNPGGGSSSERCEELSDAGTLEAALFRFAWRKRENNGSSLTPQGGEEERNWARQRVPFIPDERARGPK